MKPFLFSIISIWGTCTFSQKLQDTPIKDTLIIHIIYGSKPIDKNEPKWFGGKLGGHIGLQISDKKIIHFVPNGHVNGFNAFSDTGRFLNSSITNFYRTFPETKFKTARVYIPVNRSQFDSIISKCQNYLSNPPYPYALFGMRCASACYDLLNPVLTPSLSQNRMTWKFLKPRQFRKYIFNLARKEGWIIKLEPGSVARKWDHD